MTRMDEEAAKSFSNLLTLVRTGNSVHLAKLLQQNKIALETLNVSDKNDRTCISFAAAMGDVNMVELLLATDIPDVNLADSEGNTPLIYAVSLGHHQVTKKLLEYGSNIDQTNKNGFTALIKAAIHDHHSCVELLLKADANIELTDYTRNMNALQWAKLCGSQSCIKTLKKCKSFPKSARTIRNIDKNITKSASDVSNLKSNSCTSPLQKIKDLMHSKPSAKERLAIDSIVMCVSTPAIPRLLGSSETSALKTLSPSATAPEGQLLKAEKKSKLVNSNILPLIEITTDTGENIPPSKQCFSSPTLKHK